MKKVIFLICAVSALMICSCEREYPVEPEKKSPEYSWSIIPQKIKRDFLYRFPEAKVTSAYSYYGEYQGVAFVDNDGFRKEVVYKEGWLTLAEKWYDVDSFLSQLPRPVLGTYLATGIHNECFTDGNYYVVEAERAGMDQKQYEIHCSASFKDGDKVVDHLAGHIVISEDGTLLTCEHGGFCPTIFAYDMDQAIEAVREMYPTAELLGAYNNTGSNDRIVIRDEGIVKTVSFYSYGDEFWWEETRYSLPRLTVLPEHVLKAIDKGDDKNPERKLFNVFIVECKDGKYYGLTFGTELNYSTFYLEME
jgi:hypothetical protein